MKRHQNIDRRQISTDVTNARGKMHLKQSKFYFAEQLRIERASVHGFKLTLSQIRGFTNRPREPHLANRQSIVKIEFSAEIVGIFRSIMSSSFRFLSDEDLLAQCRVDHYRGSGPGGQKRNKTSNAVRLMHRPTGIIATATEARSTVENHLNSLRRLRIKLAAQIREPVDPLHFEPPDWFLSIRHDQKIDASHRHRFYSAAAGLMLDLLALSANPAIVAGNLGVSTTTVVKHLAAETAWWAAANDIRARQGQSPLTHK